MTPFLMGKQEGWDMAMQYIGKYCRREQTDFDKAGIKDKRMEEVAILAENMVQTEPKEFVE